MKKLCFIVFVLFVSNHLYAQRSDTTLSRKELREIRLNEMAKAEEEGLITNRRHIAGGVKLTTDGYGAFLEIGRAQSIKRSLLFQLEITEKKHPKEDKFFDPNITVEPFIYGKINYFYPVKLGVQQQFLLGNKGNRNGVQITGNVGGGLIVGLLRPYLLKVRKSSGDEFVGYDSPDSTLFLQGPYYAAPNLGTGWNQLKVTPGVYLKPAIRFDYGKFNELISAIEVGVIGEYYSKKIPQMVYQEDKKFFFSGYVAIIFGKRKN